MATINERLHKALDEHGIFAQNNDYLLRRAVEADKEWYLQFSLSKGWPDGLSDLTGRLGELMWEEWMAEDNFHTIIIRKSDGQLCGYCGLKTHTGPEIPELDIELLAAFQRQGIGSSVLPLLMKRYADVTGRRTFVSKVYYDNLASQKLMRKLGGIPAGVAPVLALPETVAQLIENIPALVEKDHMNRLAEEFGTTPCKLKTHAMVFRFDV